MWLTLACYLAATIAVAVYGEIRWHMGRSAQIHRSHKPCIAEGYRQGLMKGEDERDVLRAHLAEAADARDELQRQVDDAAAFHNRFLAGISVDQWFADVRPIVDGDRDHEVSP